MNFKKYLSGFAALGAAIFLPLIPAQAQSDSALLDALVKKGVLSDQEAEDVRASEEKDYASTSASKINISSSIKSITFYGDVRLRAEIRNGTVNAGDINSNGQVYNHNDSQTRDRYRYRLRFGVKGDLYDNFSYGFRLSSGTTYDRSGNVTFGDTDTGGEFGKAKSLLAIDQVFLAYRPTSYITLTGGKMPNPLYTTSMVWDDNLNPEGAAEQFDNTYGDAEIFATAGQFVYGDSADNGVNISGGTNYNDIFMFAEQVGFKFKFDEDTYFKMAATMYTYSGALNGNKGGTVANDYSTAPLNLAAPNNSPSFFDGPFVGAGSAPATNVTGINNLAVMETPMEFDFKAWDVHFRVFGDFAYNFDADGRANAARGAINSFVASGGVSNPGVTAAVPLAGQSQAAANNAMVNSSGFQGVLDSGKSFLDQVAYQIGIEAGQLKKKGDWDGKVYWQSTGYYAVDPNLIDADIFNAATNMKGVVTAVSHNWTDGLSSTLRYAYAIPQNDKLATPNVNQDLQISKINAYNLFQADLMWKF